MEKEKKIKIIVEQSSLPQMHLEMMEPKVCFFSMKLDFASVSQTFPGEDFGIR